MARVASRVHRSDRAGGVETTKTSNTVVVYCGLQASDIVRVKLVWSRNTCVLC